MASLRAGGELASVFTSPEASQPIKCYSPELMVVPSYDITGWEERLHVLGILGFLFHSLDKRFYITLKELLVQVKIKPIPYFKVWLK